MKKLFFYADQYAKNSTWKDFALLKFCLFAMGLAVGCTVPKKKRKLTVGLALAAFWVTYIPLMVKWAAIVTGKKKEYEVDVFPDLQ